MAEYIADNPPVDVLPVDEVGRQPNRSLSIQCSTEGSEACGTKVFAHGQLFHDTAHSRSVDSGMAELATADVEEKISNLRKELLQEIQKLKDSLVKKTEELARVTEEKNELARKLEKEKSEKADSVRRLEDEKNRLEKTVELLQKEVEKLKEEISSSINHNASLDKQIQELQQRADASDISLNNMTPDKQAELLKLCAKIGNLMVVERNPTIPEQLETDVSNTIQKMSSGVKKRDDDYKNGNGGGSNGTPQHSVDPTEENNL